MIRSDAPLAIALQPWMSGNESTILVLALLMILEPIVCTLLVWKIASHRADFPFFGVLALSVGCFLLLALYHAAIQLFSDVRDGR